MKLFNEKVVFKNSKTGKTDTMAHDEVVRAYWRRVARDFQLKLVSQGGNVLRFSGFKENVRVLNLLISKVFMMKCCT